MKNENEIRRLISDFEREARSYHDLRLSVYYITQEPNNPVNKVVFEQPNHSVRLWQHYGNITTDDDVSRFHKNCNTSDPQWGLRGSELTLFAVVEGELCDKFVRMAKRAAGIFSSDEIDIIRNRSVDEVIQKEKLGDRPGKMVISTNSNQLSDWLNYLLYHLSLVAPEREQVGIIEPDPFTLSLLALERVLEQQAIKKVDRSTTNVEYAEFQVALSFPGEHRLYVSRVADSLRPQMKTDALFYDHDFQAQFARPNLDLLLQDIYRNRSTLVVVFISQKYEEKEWCGLEWRAIRDMIKARQDARVMFISFDGKPIEGMLSVDGFIDARELQPNKVAEYIMKRVHILNSN